MLGAPPAFVLSQDQTLSLVPRPPGLDPTGRAPRDGLWPSITAQGRPPAVSTPTEVATPKDRSKATGPNPPRHGTRASPKGMPERRPGAEFKPATFLHHKMPGPRDPKRPPPTHPFRFSTCPKTKPGPRRRDTALLCRQTSPYSRKAGLQQALFAAVADINLQNEIATSRLSMC